MSLHSLCIHHKQPPQKIALLTNQIWETVVISNFFSRPRLIPVAIIYIFPYVSPSSPSLIFKSLTLPAAQNRSMDSVLIIKSTAYSSSHGQPVSNSLDGGLTQWLREACSGQGLMSTWSKLLAAHCSHFPYIFQVFYSLDKYPIFLKENGY